MTFFAIPNVNYFMLSVIIPSLSPDGERGRSVRLASVVRGMR
jgi:hypothetical protein